MACIFLSVNYDYNEIDIIILACEEGPGICAHLLTLASMLIIFMTLPISLCMVVKVVQVNNIVSL